MPDIRPGQRWRSVLQPEVVVVVLDTPKPRKDETPFILWVPLVEVHTGFGGSLREQVLRELYTLEDGDG